MTREEDFLGAVASNAGDEFHVLWTLREILRLLDGDGDVEEVKVEGLPLDETHAQVGEHGQAVDVALTRAAAGGRLHSYRQLKYSASNPQSGWTWSRLLAPRVKNRPKTSVLGKLAGLMKAVEFKGDFAIVSNQPLPADVASDVARLAANSADLTPDEVARRQELCRKLGLNEAELATFLGLWDLSTFKSSSRLLMEGEVIKRLADLTDADGRDDASQLHKRVSMLMLPESRNDSPVTREQLLVWLGAGTSAMLFPAPSRIEPAQPYLRRRVVDGLVSRLSAPQRRPLRVHAGGGCGKTSVLIDLPAVLPSGSEVFLYDCYGGGLFLASDQKRHLPEQVFCQIGNEIAARLLTPLVVRRHGSADVFEAFRRRVEVAAELVKLRGADALLVLCFDAVDNARTGARHWQEGCFLDALCQASGWPGNVRIIVSCRTARREDVGAQDRYDDFEISGFDVDEVRDLVSLWQPTWRTDIAETLQDLTGGNPRRLVYAMQGLPGNGEAHAIERLMPKAEGINPLFEKRVDEAGRHLGDVRKVWRMLDALAHLPRPVPARILATLAGLVPADISDIAVDVGGILEREDGWSFHDEDFEAFVIEHPSADGKTLLSLAADLLFESRLTDRYAATSLAEVLVAAGRLDALYKLVTKELEPASVLPPLEAQFVWSRRLALAIRCCRAAGDIANACSLLIASTEAIGRAKLLEDLTVGNLDLSVRFAADEANRLVLASQRHRHKRPNLRIELARSAASTHPESAEAQLRWWRAHLQELRDARQTESEKADRSPAPRVTEADIASEYEVLVQLKGEQAAFERLFAWHPQSALARAFHVLAQRSAGCNRQSLLRAIDARGWPPRALAPMMAAALLAGADLGDAVMRSAFVRLASATKARWAASIEGGLSHSPLLAWHEAVLLICERAVLVEGLRPLVSQLLARSTPEPVIKEPHELYRLRSDGARQARAFVLRERISGTVVAVEDWLPPRRVEQPDVRTKQRRREQSPEAYWNQSLEETASAFSCFVNAARATLAAVCADPAEVWSPLADSLRRPRRHDRSYDRDSDQAVLLTRARLVHAGINGRDVTGLLPDVRKVWQHWRTDNIPCALDLAKTLGFLPRAHDAALTILPEVAKRIAAEALPASDRVGFFSKSARIALPLDEALAKWLFSKAVAATSSVDFEARGALAAAGAIAQTGLGGSPAERALSGARLGDAVGAVVESIGLVDFEWEKAAQWVTAASLPAGLMTASRWHDRGLALLASTLPRVIAAGPPLSLPQRVALATLAAAAPLEPSDSIGNDALLPGWVVKRALADRLHEGSPRAFLTALAQLEGRAGRDASEAIAAAGPYRDAFLAWGHVPHRQDGAADADGADEAVTQLSPLQSVDDIRADLASGSAASGPTAAQFRSAARRLAKLPLRVPFLQVALELGADSGELARAVPLILKQWSSYPPVDAWMKESYPAYVVASLHRMFPYQYQDTELAESALEATRLDPVKQADVILEAVERRGERMPPEMLYALTGLVAARAPAEARISLFDALLQRIEARVTHEPTVRLAGCTPPEDAADCVARTLYAAMGDIDRRVRWRACHAGLALLRGGDPAWDLLVSCLARNDESVFAGAPFYRYAALEQLVMLLQRAAVEKPHVVGRYAELILTTIHAEPHVIVRELGRSVLLILDQAGAWKPSEADRAFVERLNRSQHEPIPRDVGPRHNRAEERSRERKYRFDDMDAIPYWYQPAAGLFGMNTGAFLDRLESWIHGRWGYDEDSAHWSHDPRLDRVQNAHELTSRRHGARPTIEGLRHHVEWHAMMCAVGELIVEQPLVASRHGNELEAWIGRSLPTVAPHWLSDLRDSAPLEPRFWGAAPDEAPQGEDGSEDQDAQSAAWAGSLTAEDFARELDDAGDLVVAAEFELAWGSATQKVSIRSALVSPPTARSLAQAFANATNRMDFALPEAGDHEGPTVPGFELEGWLAISDRDPKADKFDERRGIVSGIPARPVGPVELGHLKFHHGSWLSPDGTAVLKIRQWGSEGQGNGWRATAGREFIRDMLTRRGRSLILLLEMSRQLQGDPYDGDRTRWMLCVLDGAGNLTSVDRERRRSLGRVLVRKEGLTHGGDMLGRWMMHRVAELVRQRGDTDESGRLFIDAEVGKVCDAFSGRDRF